MTDNQAIAIIQYAIEKGAWMGTVPVIEADRKQVAEELVKLMEEAGMQNKVQHLLKQAEA